MTTTTTLARVATARDLMRREIVTVGPGISTLDLVRMMNRYDVHGAPVVDDALRVAGVVSRADVHGLLRFELGLDVDPAAEDIGFAEWRPDGYFRFAPTTRRIAWPEDPRLRDHTVEEIMSAAAFTVEPSTPAPEIRRLLDQAGLHRILVVENHRLKGLVTPFDLMLVPSGW